MRASDTKVSSIKVLLTQAQRQAIADSLPKLAGRLKLCEKNQRTIPFTIGELQEIKRQARETLPHAGTGMKWNSLRHIVDAFAKAIEDSHGIMAIPATERLYQFMITL